MDSEQSRSSNGKDQVSGSFIWTTILHDQLLSLYDKFPDDWAAISQQLVGTTASICEQEYLELKRNQHSKRQRWSEAEDKELRQLVEQFGRKWSQISKEMKNRTGKQVRERYLNYIENSQQGEIHWTTADDKKIISLYKKFGAKWSYISTLFKGTTENKIKNRFYSKLQRQYQHQINQSDESEDPIEDISDEPERKVTVKTLKKKIKIQQIEQNEEQKQDIVPIQQPVPVYDPMWMQYMSQLLVAQQFQYQQQCAYFMQMSQNPHLYTNTQFP